MGCKAAVTVVYAAQGYPDEPPGLDHSRCPRRTLADVVVFHAGTREDGRHAARDGGRVLSVTAAGDDLAAIARAYAAAERIDWPGGFCRSDIGWRALG